MHVMNFGINIETPLMKKNRYNKKDEKSTPLSAETGEKIEIDNNDNEHDVEI